MLSTPTNNLQTRQRQHRRQNSTPTAFEKVKVNSLPNIPKHAAHRRGMSMDQRRKQTSLQDTNMVSKTNTGYQTTQQHILRETQQQRLARPGQHYNNFNDENYLNSPAVTPQRQSFDAGCISQYGDRGLQSQYQYSGPVNSTANMNFSQDYSLYQTGSDAETNSRRNSAARRISGGILDRVAQFENLALQSPQRPVTPTYQTAIGK
jgi:regulatory protein SWI5